MCSCTGLKSNTDTLDANSLGITIGPISEFYYYNSKHSWEFELPVNISNNCKQPLYIANPDPRYDSWGDLKFFLINPDGVSMEESPDLRVRVLIFGEDCWKKLQHGKSIIFPRHVVVSQRAWADAFIEANNNIQFFSTSWRGDSYKIREGEYKLFAKFTYDNQRPQDERRWLEWVHLPVNNVELSRFWHGKIESNHLALELKEVKK
jgi:hypothetical protein